MDEFAMFNVALDDPDVIDKCKYRKEVYCGFMKTIYVVGKLWFQILC